MKTQKQGVSRFHTIEKSVMIKSISGGLVMLIPVVMIGSFSLLLRTLQFLRTSSLLHGFWRRAGRSITVFYNATFGMLSVFLTLTVSPDLFHGKIPIRSQIPTAGQSVR